MRLKRRCQSPKSVIHEDRMHTLFEPERVLLELDDMATVGEAVQEGRGEPGITEDLLVREGCSHWL